MRLRFASVRVRARDSSAKPPAHGGRVDIVHFDVAKEFDSPRRGAAV
jgi:hypothetical protein